jgi:quinol monooxygenase YgiN
MTYKEDTSVSIAAKFKIKEGKTVDAIKVHADKMIGIVKANETMCNEYAMSISGDKFYFRESYENADGVLAHLGNVGELLGELLKDSADLLEIDLHGPAAELAAKLKEPLAHLNPTFFELQPGGIRKA